MVKRLTSAQVSDFSSGHDLAVYEFEPRVGLCADSSEPGACFRCCVSLALLPLPIRALSLSQIKINIRKINTIKKKTMESKVVPRFFAFDLNNKVDNVAI